MGSVPHVPVMDEVGLREKEVNIVLLSEYHATSEPVER